MTLLIQYFGNKSQTKKRCRLPSLQKPYFNRKKHSYSSTPRAGHIYKLPSTHHDFLAVHVQLEDLGEELRPARVHHLLGVVRVAEDNSGDGPATLDAHRLGSLKRGTRE